MSRVEELQAKAARCFQTRPSNFPVGTPYNCSDSVLLPLVEYLGVKSALILQIATSMGAGFSLDGLTCNSISGVALALGLIYGRTSNDENPQII